MPARVPPVDHADDSFFDNTAESLGLAGSGERADLRTELLIIARDYRFSRDLDPPEKNQFVKGGPGGPGRPKGTKTIDGALRKVFGGKVPYLENGNRKEGLAVEALAKRALHHGLSGSARANEAALNLVAKYGPGETAEGTREYDLSRLTSEDKQAPLRLLCLANGRSPPRSSSTQ